MKETPRLPEVAFRCKGWTLLWDSKNMKITNDEAANKSLFMRRLAPATT